VSETITSGREYLWRLHQAFHPSILDAFMALNRNWRPAKWFGQFRFRIIDDLSASIIITVSPAGVCMSNDAGWSLKFSKWTREKGYLCSILTMKGPLVSYLTGQCECQDFLDSASIASSSEHDSDADNFLKFDKGFHNTKSMFKKKEVMQPTPWLDMDWAGTS
jgi:hypothetical protein